MVRAGLRDDVVDVVVDPFADEQDRLAAAAHRAEPLGDVAQRVERGPRVERALHVVGIVERDRPAARMSRVRLYSLVLFAVAESSLRPCVLSTAASSSCLLLVNS